MNRGGKYSAYYTEDNDEFMQAEYLLISIQTSRSIGVA